MSATRSLGRQLRSDRGDGLIDGLLMLGLLLLVVVVVVQTLLWVHARSIADGAAQDGARAAATGGADAGIARAEQVLAAGGGTSDRLRARASADEAAVTVEVVGDPPRVFPLGFVAPAVRASATLPTERYPTLERQP